jgi:hypothetical protein
MGTTTNTTSSEVNTRGFWICTDLGSTTPIVCPHGFIAQTLTHGTHADVVEWAKQGYAQDSASACERLHPYARRMTRREFVNAIREGDPRTRWRQS